MLDIKTVGASWVHPKHVAIRLSIVATFLGSAATVSATHLDAIQDDFFAQREKWQSLNVDDYTYRFQRICNCLPEFTAPWHRERLRRRDHVG